MKTAIAMAALALSLASTAVSALEDKNNPFLNLNTTQEKMIYATAILTAYIIECNGLLTDEGKNLHWTVRNSFEQEVKTALLKTRFFMNDIGKANFCRVTRNSFGPMIRSGD